MPSDLLEFLYDALRSPHGIIIREESGNRDLLKAKLYKERKTDPQLKAISIADDPDDPASLILLKKESPDAT